jgi:hypothetical protein
VSPGPSTPGPGTSIFCGIFGCDPQAPPPIFCGIFGCDDPPAPQYPPGNSDKPSLLCQVLGIGCPQPAPHGASHQSPSAPHNTEGGGGNPNFPPGKPCGIVGCLPAGWPELLMQF